MFRTCGAGVRRFTPDTLARFTAAASFETLHEDFVQELNLAPGLLLSMPQLADPNFTRAVVLMLDHGDDGSFGLILNHPTPLGDQPGSFQSRSGLVRRLRSRRLERRPGHADLGLDAALRLRGFAFRQRNS